MAYTSATSVIVDKVIKFPTAPATVSLANQKRLIAVSINSFEELLKKIFENSTDNLPLAVFLSIEARSMEEMLKIKRSILQQFIFFENVYSDHNQRKF